MQELKPSIDPRAGRRVLITSANAALVGKLETLLHSQGRKRFVALSASSLQSAITVIEKAQVDVVLYDLSLDPQTPVESLRSMVNAAAAPVVIMTEVGQESLSLKCLDEGAQEYLPKEDMTAINLRRALDYAISRHRANDLRMRLEHSDKLAALGQLTAGVAHEINNPATYVLGNLREIEEVVQRLIEGEGHAGDLELIADMARDCRRGVDLIASISKELKFFARSDDESLEAVDIQELITNTSAMTLNEIRYRAEFVQDVEPGLPTLVGSRSKLSQVLVNLLINAAHAITSGPTSENRIAISAKREGNNIVLRVEDTGAGIAVEDMAKIFEAYYTTKPRGQGTGLGLPICREIIEQHHGRLEVESTVGVGTTFTITLPLDSGLRISQQVAIVTPVPTPAPPEPKRERRRILLIDDEPLLLKSLSRMLQSHHDVVIAIGGARGLEVLAESGDFDTIICDLMMPEVDGLHVYDVLRRDYPALVSKLIYLSGGVFTERMSSFLDELQPQLLDKPVSRDALLQAIAGQNEAP